MPTPSVSGSVNWLRMSSAGKMQLDTVKEEQEEAKVEEVVRERRRRRAKKRETLGATEARLRCFWCSGGSWGIAGKDETRVISFLIIQTYSWDQILTRVIWDSYSWLQ